MNDTKSTDRVMVAVLCLVAAALAWTGVMAATSAQVAAQCLRLGYPGSRYTWSREAFCTARVDGTDIVVPLREAKPR